MTLVLRYAARSDRGLVRSNNQDSVYAGPRLLAIADGMGGHAAGEVASKVVVAALAPLDDDEPGDDLLGQLREAVRGGNSAIAELVASDPELEGMGTTVTAVLFAGRKLGLVHVGDSRAYLHRDGSLAQITHDDTFVQSLIDEGRITEEEAATHPQRSLLLRALTGHEVEPSLAVREARAGDRYLICSDGLTAVVSHETLQETLQMPDPQTCADRLIELALKGGGPDNVTVVVADVVDIDYGEDTPIVGGAAGFDSEDTPPAGDSPAARAGAALPPRPKPVQVQPPEPEPEERSKGRRALRTTLITLVVLALIAAGAFGVRQWVLRQYYIGANPNQQVVIYQGVSGSVLGVALHREVENACSGKAQPDCEQIKLGDLYPSKRAVIENGSKPVSDLDEARKQITLMRANDLLPPCPTTTAAPPTPNPAPPTTTTNPAPPPGGTPPPTSNPPSASDVPTTTTTSTTMKRGEECREG
ncbi:serine/threonine-protein phosphatase [Pseudonocardiaceae bacterium YIM PH 21723]|nr:serine/threonine-protein phosphatase [Pseudonocardiaceae bacterium YIM PH 21723]